MRHFINVAATLMLVVGALPVTAQDYPSRPIKMLVGFAPGGGTDIAGRIIAKKLAENLKQQVIVENRPGGGGVLATELIANAVPDGYTINLGAVGPLTVNPHIQKLRYNVERDLAPISMAVTFPNVLVVHPGVKANTLAEFVALARAPASNLAYGSSGIGSAGHLAGELFNGLANVNITHVAYKGGGPAMTDLLGGQLAAIYASLPSAMGQIHSGKIRALAVTGPKRSRDLPNVPTIAESGFAGYEATNWYAFVAPAKTPRPIIDRLVVEISIALRAKDTLEELAKHGMEALPGTPEALAAHIKRETETWGRVVAKAGIKAE
jgi:tripartite-type tricarboxylate transporter receptor subunit TctC